MLITSIDVLTSTTFLFSLYLLKFGIITDLYSTYVVGWIGSLFSRYLGKLVNWSVNLTCVRVSLPCVAQ